MDLGTVDNPRPVFLSASLSNEEILQYMDLLREFSDVFAWSYAEMPGLDPKIAMHRHPRRCKAREASPKKIPPQCHGPNPKRGPEVKGCRLHQGGAASRLACQHRTRHKEKWANQGIFGI